MELKDKHFLRELETLYNNCANSMPDCKHEEAEVSHDGLGVYKFYCPACKRIGFSDKIGALTLGWISYDN